jgi:hypothetical protein
MKAQNNNSRFSKVNVRCAIALTLVLLQPHANAWAVNADQLSELYLSRLSEWVKGGGVIETIQTSVVQNCGKLVFVKATQAEQASYLGGKTDDFDFRIDVCTKMFINSVHHQPEFDNPEIVKSICDTNQPLFTMLCVKTGLR